MSRFRSCSKLALSVLAVSLLGLIPKQVLATSCRKDAECVRAFAKAEAAMTQEQKRVALAELQAVYVRVLDPRLLVSIGRLEEAVGQFDQARESCMRAQSLAPTDLELQRQAQDCIAKLPASLLPDAGRVASPTLTRVEAKSGAARADATVHNNIQVNPKISVAPQVHLSPQIHVQLPPVPRSSVEAIPFYRRWWFGAGTAVLVVGAIGLGVGLAVREPNTDGYMKYPLALATK